MLTIEEVQAARTELERELADLITKFEGDTEAWVESVEITPRETIGKHPPQMAFLKVKVRI